MEKHSTEKQHHQNNVKEEVVTFEVAATAGAKEEKKEQKQEKEEKEEKGAELSD